MRQKSIIGLISIVVFTIILIANPTQYISNGKSDISNEIYPNKKLTPGDVIQAATKDDICTPGYSSKIRDVSSSIKLQVYKEYNVSYPQKRGDYEVDHFVPLELGGSNDIKNLWLEPASPTPGFHQKDIVENYLHKKVCDNKIDLKEAQDKIMSDWYKVYLDIKN